MENTLNIAYLWLIAGGAMVVAEFILLPGVGFLFAGLAALIVGLLIETGVITDPLWQWIIFFALTISWAALLWKTLTRKNPDLKIDIKGDKAVLITALEPGKTGKARWSGTIVNAKLAPEHQSALAEGAEVEILKAEGNTVIVK